MFDSLNLTAEFIFLHSVDQCKHEIGGKVGVFDYRKGNKGTVKSARTWIVVIIDFTQCKDLCVSEA